MTDHSRESQFLTTQWTQILDSREGSADSSSDALIALCQNYHQPVLVFIRNRCGDPEKARDLCQGFFELLIGSALIPKETLESLQNRYKIKAVS